MSQNPEVLRLGTRASLLAKMQSQQVASAIESLWPGLRVELVTCVSTGDKVQDRPLHEIGGKGLFTKELEESLLRRDVDFAVHSLKDVPVTMPLVDTADLVIAAVPEREDPRDVLVAGPSIRSVKDLKQGATVGTGSLRRQAQIRALRPDLKVDMIRGNVDTRLRKQREGQYDAVILAMAGLKRSGLYDETAMSPIPPEEMLPAAGQGALALQCRRDATRVREILGRMDDPSTHTCVELERAIVLSLNGDCHSPIAALAVEHMGQISLLARVAARGGTPPVIAARATGSACAPHGLVTEVEMALKQQGAERLLAGTF